MNLKWPPEQRTANTGLAKVEVQCSADTFVVNQSLVLHINICGKIATFAKPETVTSHSTANQHNTSDSTHATLLKILKFPFQKPLNPLDSIP